MTEILLKIPVEYYALSGLVNFLTSFSIGLFVVLKDFRSKPNRTFSIFCLAVAFWSIVYFWWLITPDPEKADALLRTCMIGVIFMPSTFTHFIVNLLSIKPKKGLIFVNYLISLGLAFTIYTPLYATQGGPFMVFPYWAKPGPLFAAHLIHFGLNVIYAHYKMHQAYSGKTNKDVTPGPVL